MSLAMIALALIVVLLVYLCWQVIRKVSRRDTSPPPRGRRRARLDGSPGYNSGVGTDAGTWGYFGSFGADPGGSGYCDSGGFGDAGGGCDGGGGS